MLNIKKQAVLVVVVFIFSIMSAGAVGLGDEIDSLRADLASQKDKSAPQYIKTKEKLKKLITLSRYDYSAQARIADVQRLIKEQKYSSALYELHDLIENNLEVSKSYECLAQISSDTSRNTAEVANYLKKAVAYDSSNISAIYKLAKLYLKAGKNILGTEYLKKTIELSPNSDYFSEIEEIILNNVHPQNRYESNNLYEALGMLYLKSGRDFDGYSAYNKALEMNPNDIALRYQLADLLYSSNQNDSAIALYNTILSQNPGDAQIRNSKAKLFIKKGNISSALNEYQMILNMYPDSKQAQYGIYQLCRNNLSPRDFLIKLHGDRANYVPSFKEAMRFSELLNELDDYEGAMAFKNYARQIKAEQQEQAKQQEEALNKKKAELLLKQQEDKLREQQEQEKIRINNEELIRKAKEQEKIRKVQEQLAETKKEELRRAQQQEQSKMLQVRKELDRQRVKESLSKKAKQLEQIEDTDTKVIKKQVKKQEANTIKKLQDEKNRIDKFEERKAQAKSKEVQNMQKQTAVLKPMSEEDERLELENAKKRKQTALEEELEAKRQQEKKLIETIEKRKTLNNTALDKEIKILQTSKNEKTLNCKKTVDEYLKTKPITSSIYIAVANTYRQANMPYHAIKYFEEAKKLEPLNSDIYYNIGLVYMELNRLDEAKENLDKAINLDKDNKKALTLLPFINQKIATGIINDAYQNFANKKYIEAYTILDKGIKELSDNAQLYYYRGLVADAMNRNGSAIIDFNKSIDLDPGYYMSYYYLAKCYEKIKDGKSALVAYERFLSTEPDEKDLVDEVQKKVIILGQKYY